MTLLKGDGTPYDSPSFPLGGTTGYFRVDAQQTWGTNPTLDVAMEHRNEDETAWTVAGSFSRIRAVGSTPLAVSNLKEILRLKFTVGGTEVHAGWHIMALAPQWLPS